MSISYKLVIIGDGEVGKTAFLKRYRVSEFERKYLATVGTELHYINFNTDIGDICFKCWDTAGQDKFAGLKDGYYLQADCAIIMFDVTNPRSYINLNKWYNDLIRTCGNIPIVICGNKVDDPERKIKPEHVKFHQKNDLKYYEISAKTNYNIEKPFLYLARQITDRPDLIFLERPALDPYIINIVSHDDK